MTRNAINNVMLIHGSDDALMYGTCIALDVHWSGGRADTQTRDPYATLPDMKHWHLTAMECRPEAPWAENIPTIGSLRVRVEATKIKPGT